METVPGPLWMADASSVPEANGVPAEVQLFTCIDLLENSQMIELACKIRNLSK